VRMAGIEWTPALLLGEEWAFGSLRCDVHGGRMFVHVFVIVLMEIGIRATILESRTLIDFFQADYFCAIKRAFAIFESGAFIQTLQVNVLERTSVLLESRAFLHL